MPSPPTNSLLNLLNPYASVTASQAARDRDDDGDTEEEDKDGRGAAYVPESPSAVLLRELQYESGNPSASASMQRSASAAASSAPRLGAAMARGRSSGSARRSPPTSPTPTPGNPRPSAKGKSKPAAPTRPATSAAVSSSGSSSHVAPIRPSHIIADSSDDDGPPQSLMFDGTTAADGGSTPTQSGLVAPAPRWKNASRSPGPFRRRPSSTSSSTQSPTSPLPRVLDPEPLLPGRTAAGLVHVPESTSTESDGHSPRSTRSTRSTTASTSTESELPTARPWAADPRAPRVSVDNRELHDQDPLLESPPTPGPSRTRRQGKHKYHSVPTEVNRADRDRDRRDGGPDLKKAGLSAYNKALWKWVNVTDLDAFLQDAYSYYAGKGFWCILLRDGLQLLTLAFVIGFTTFLTQCIDYSKIRNSVGPNSNGRLKDMLVPQCPARSSFFSKLVLILVCAAYAVRVVAFFLSIPNLLDMYRFYTYLLGVQDADVQTMPWPEIVRLIGDIKTQNPITSHSNSGALAQVLGQPKGESPKLDAHDIANRILRQENYLIALFNKDLLDLRVRLPIPKAVEHLIPPSLVTSAPGSGLPRSSGDDRKYLTFGGNTLTRALEFCLRFCVMGYLFDHNGQVRKEVVRDRASKEHVRQLQQRFIFMGLVNAALAPFIVIYTLIYSFFRYFAEYKKNPSYLGTRKYTLYAQWKFREFNELPHLFALRLSHSYPVAKEYIDQFPNERTSLLMRFVAFIFGAFAAVLAVATFVDPEVFLHLEITPHATILFYLGVCTGVYAAARGMVSDENSTFDPEYHMRDLIRYTHYLPPEWKGKLHSPKVHKDFGQLFQLKVVIFAHELISVLVTPFILWFSLPGCAGAVVDFFREFTIHVEGIGYVCSFAVFDFHRPGAVGPDGAAAAAAEATTAGAPPSPVIRRRSTAGATGYHVPAVRAPKPDFYDNKTEQSIFHFKTTHPDWQPTDPSASVFLEKLMSDNKDQHAQGRSTHLASSVYGGRATGLGLHLGGHHSHGHKQAAHVPALSPGVHGPGSRWFQPATASDGLGLATMDENEDVEDDREAEAMGWDRRIVTEDSEEIEEDRGLLRDAGILLNQVMNR